MFLKLTMTCDFVCNDIVMKKIYLFILWLVLAEDGNVIKKYE